MRQYNPSKRILVTGGAGFLGSHLCDRLIEAGHDVLCVDNFFTGTKRNIEHLLDHPQFELMRLQETLGLTFVIVTHDQQEAMTVADRIGVMDGGRLIQVGTPPDIYEEPSSRWVADFIGEVNLIEGRVIETGAAGTVVASASAGQLCAPAHAQCRPGDTVWVALRPEKLRILLGPPAATAGGNSAAGQVAGIAYLGDLSIYQVRLDSGFVTIANQFRDEPQAFDVETLGLEIRSRTVTFLGTAGLTEWLDVSAAIPVVSLTLEGQRMNTYRGQQLLQASGAAEATGLGDMAIRAKVRLNGASGSGLALVGETRLPTGREEDLLGSGETSFAAIEGGPAMWLRLYDRAEEPSAVVDRQRLIAHRPTSPAPARRCPIGDRRPSTSASSST